MRAVAGRSAGWYRGSALTHEGQITVEGTAHDVVLGDADPALGTEIDDEYGRKYRRWPAETDSLLTDISRGSRLRIQPVVWNVRPATSRLPVR